MGQERALLNKIKIERGSTEKDVNYYVLKFLLSRYDTTKPLKVLDLPCGSMLFLTYVQKLFKSAVLKGADLENIKPSSGIQFVQMDLTEEFKLEPGETFDLITSISGVMMFGNTLSFIKNCARRLNNGGRFIVTNDNSTTILDKFYFLFLDRYRLFKPVFEDKEPFGITQNVSIQELCYLLRTNGFEILDIKYTSVYKKHLLLLPIALLIYPFQWLYLKRYKSSLPQQLKWQMYPFKHLFCKHYIIYTEKVR